MAESLIDRARQAAPAAAARLRRGGHGIGRAARLLTLSPARLFQLFSLFVLIGGAVGTSAWLGRKIEERVIINTVSINSLYVDSLITPSIQDLGAGPVMSAADVAMMNEVLTHTPLGVHLAALILWSDGGHVLYSSAPEQIGKTFPLDDELVGAFGGAVKWELTESEDESHIPPQHKSTQLLAMYSPVRDLTNGRVIAVVEFYQPFDPLAADIASAQHETWLIVGGATLLMYLLLASFIERVSATIVTQQIALRDKVSQLTDLLEQNDLLYERVQRATHSAATTSERVMRRISADLHDGAAQYLGTAALHLDQIAIYHREQGDERVEPHITRAQSALNRAIEDVRGVASGLKIPQLEAMSLDMVIADAVVRHEQHTNTSVSVVVNEMPDEVSPAVKVTLYRVLQEALSNAYRHGRGVEQRVETNAQYGMLEVLISDAGPGFQTDAALDTLVHMGLSGMRDRVESLGGQFIVTSQIGKGTQVRIVLPFDEEAEETTYDDD